MVKLTPAQDRALRMVANGEVYLSIRTWFRRSDWKVLHPQPFSRLSQMGLIAVTRGGGLDYDVHLTPAGAEHMESLS